MRHHNDQVATVVLIGHATEWNTHDRVEKAEGKSQQQPHLGFGQFQVCLNRSHHQTDDLPIDERYRVRDCQ